MKKQISPGVMISAIVVAVGVLVLVAWRMFAPPPPPTDSPEARAAAQRMIEGFKSSARQSMPGKQ